KAEDNSQITANAGGFGIGLALSSDGTAIGASIGISAATNNVGNHVLAYVDGSTATARTGSVTIESSETATIQALTIGGPLAVGPAGGATGVGVGAAGAGSGNTIKNHVEAYAQNGAEVSAPAGQITLSAIDIPTIIANAGGVGIGIGGAGDGGVGVGASLGV